jgi:hypothetical protein
LLRLFFQGEDSERVGGGGRGRRELDKLLMGYMPARWGSESVIAGETISGVARVFSAVVMKALVSAITIIVVIIVVTIIKTVPTILAVMPSIAARLPVPLAWGGGAVLVAAIRAVQCNRGKKSQRKVRS